MAKPKQAPGKGLDRSTEAVVEAARSHRRPEPEITMPDRRTTSSRRGG